MMPVFDIKALVVSIAKVALMIFIFSSIILFFNYLSGELFNIIRKTYSLTDSLHIEFGYFACAIGLDKFLTDLVSSIYMAVSIYLSSIISIVVFRYTIVMFKMLMSF
jgi:hypothetical protein